MTWSVEKTDEKRARGRDAKRRFDDRTAAIDGEIDAAMDEIDWSLRESAEKDIVAWVRAYCVGLLLDDPPPPKGEEVLREMAHAITAHENYLICLPRGSGKSCYVECVALYALATGLQKYVAIFAHNATNAKAILGDIWRAVTSPDTALSRDYPHLSLPFQLCNGCTRRRQLYRGQSTELTKNASSIVFGTLKGISSGTVITARGITSGFRGMKHGTLRPSLVILDDLQDSSQAENQEQVEKLLTLIKKDVMNLGGKERLSILQCATPISPDDLVERLKKDPSWRTTIYKAVIAFPDDLQKKEGSLWKRYFELYQTEQITGGDHSESLSFYSEHRAEMDAGAVVFNPFRFSERDGHISAIQKLLEIRHAIGEAAFQSEYQMSPLKRTFAVEVSPEKILQKITTSHALIVPDGFRLVIGSIDVNPSYGLTILLTAFRPDSTAHIPYHQVIPVRIDSALPDIAYGQRVHEALSQAVSRLKGLGIKIDCLAIDAGGKNFQAVTNFCKTTPGTCAFVGRSATQFNPFVKSRLRDAIGKTVLCGDAMERVRSGAGVKYVFFDADFYKEQAQRAIVAPLNSAGSLSLFQGAPEVHRDFAIQFANEKLLSISRKSGREVYEWQSRNPHDFLDCGAMCYAVAASQGIGTGVSFGVRTARQRPHAKPRIRIV